MPDEQNTTSTTPSNLPAEHVFQGVGTSNCGPACMEMVYRLRGKQITVSDILNDFAADDNGNDTYPAQIAKHLLVNGINSTIHISNSRVLPPVLANASKEELEKFLQKWLINNYHNEWFMFGLHLLFFSQAGGTVKLHSYNLADMQQMLWNGSVLILALENSWLWGKRYRTIDGKPGIEDNYNGKASGHMVLVKAQQGDDFEIWDPYSGTAGVYHVPAQQVVNANLNWSATIVEVTR